MIDWTQTLHAKTLVILERAESLDDLGNARGLIAEPRKNLELLGRLAGVLDPTTVNVDARRQYAILARLGEPELRALATGAVIDADVVEEPPLIEAAP